MKTATENGREQENVPDLRALTFGAVLCHLLKLCLQNRRFNTLRTGDADLSVYITTVQDG